MFFTVLLTTFLYANPVCSDNLDHAVHYISDSPERLEAKKISDELCEQSDGVLPSETEKTETISLARACYQQIALGCKAYKNEKVDTAKKIGDFLKNPLDAIQDAFESFATSELGRSIAASPLAPYAPVGEKAWQTTKMVCTSLSHIDDISKEIWNSAVKHIRNFRCLPKEQKVEKMCQLVGMMGPQLLEEVLLAASGAGSIKYAAKFSMLAKKLEKLSSYKKIKKTASTKSSLDAKKAGILADANNLKNLKDGSYIFLMDDSGRLVMSPRFLDDTDFNLAKHVSLERKLADDVLGGREPNIIGAGEFYVLNGKVHKFTNKSGSFRGDADALEISFEEFKSKGLPVSDKTKKVDVSLDYVDGAHAKEVDVAIFKKNILDSDKDNKKLFDEFRSTVKKVLAQNKIENYDDFQKVMMKKMTDDPEDIQVVAEGFQSVNLVFSEPTEAYMAFNKIASAAIREHTQKIQKEILKYQSGKLNVGANKAKQFDQIIKMTESEKMDLPELVVQHFVMGDKSQSKLVQLLVPNEKVIKEKMHRAIKENIQAIKSLE